MPCAVPIFLCNAVPIFLFNVSLAAAPSERMLETKPSEWWLLGSSPEVRLEEGADAVTPLELMVTSMRSRIVEVAADADAGEEAR